MKKVKFTNLLSLVFVAIILSGCDAWSIDIVVRQSIKNLSSDTIVFINSKNEFRGISIEDTIICFPYSETIFYEASLQKQPLEPYDVPLILQDVLINTSSGRILAKDIFNNNNWEFDKQKKQEWLRFVITEKDLE